MARAKRGWFGESARHAAAAKGIKTVSESRFPVDSPERTILPIERSINPFLFNPRRKKLWSKALSLLDSLKKGYGGYRELKEGVSEVYVFGSFATNKERPKDIDLVIFDKRMPHSPSGFALIDTASGGEVEFFIIPAEDKMESLGNKSAEALKKYESPVFVDVTGYVF